MDGSEDKSPPKFYKLNSEDGKQQACLATDFSNNNDTKINEVNLPWGDAVRAEKSYTQVALISNNDSSCPETPLEKSSNEGWPFETDEKINFLSLTILGLRILFLKTIIFNVLMTLRLWIS